MARPKGLTIKHPYDRITGLEEEARMYAGAILKAGADLDPMLYSQFCSKFLYVASKARRLRVKLGVR